MLTCEPHSILREAELCAHGVGSWISWALDSTGLSLRNHASAFFSSLCGGPEAHCGRAPVRLQDVLLLQCDYILDGLKPHAQDGFPASSAAVLGIPLRSLPRLCRRCGSERPLREGFTYRRLDVLGVLWSAYLGVVLLWTSAWLCRRSGWPLACVQGWGPRGLPCRIWQLNRSWLWRNKEPYSGLMAHFPCDWRRAVRHICS